MLSEGFKGQGKTGGDKTPAKGICTGNENRKTKGRQFLHVESSLSSPSLIYGTQMKVESGSRHHILSLNRKKPYLDIILGCSVFAVSAFTVGHKS